MIKKNKENNLTLKNMKNYVEIDLKNEKKISLSGISNIVKKYGKFSFKKVSVRHCNVLDENLRFTRNLVAKFVIHANLDNFHFVSIDECGIDLSLRKRYVWGPKNKKIILKSYPKFENISFLAAIDENGVLSGIFLKKAANQFVFLSFLKKTF